MSKEIVIAGSGVAGLALAKELAGQPDIHTTIIAPGLYQSPQSVSTNGRISTPIVSQVTADALGLDYSQTPEITSAQFGIKDERGLRRVVRNRISRFAQKVLSASPLHAIDAEQSRLRLLAEVQQLSQQEGSNVVLVNGKALGLRMQGDRVTGVLAEGQEEPIGASLVIDATGRPARLASSLDARHVKERRKPQFSTILGGYVDLRDPQLRREFPGIETDLIVGVLPGKTIAILAPTEPLPNSTATHVLLIEGNPALIQNAVRQAKDGTLEEKRLAAIKLLVNGTRWTEIISRISHIDRTVLFTNRDSVYRQPQVAGLALVGDAQGYVNPINGIGFGYIAADVKMLVEHIATTENLDEAVRIYNAEMERVFRRRQRS